jgi:hypothetical protein
MAVSLRAEPKGMAIVSSTFRAISNFRVDRPAISVSTVWTKPDVRGHATERTTQAAL